MTKKSNLGGFDDRKATRFVRGNNFSRVRGRPGDQLPGTVGSDPDWVQAGNVRSIEIPAAYLCEPSTDLNGRAVE